MSKRTHLAAGGVLGLVGLGFLAAVFIAQVHQKCGPLFNFATTHADTVAQDQQVLRGDTVKSNDPELQKRNTHVHCVTTQVKKANGGGWTFLIVALVAIVIAAWLIIKGARTEDTLIEEKRKL